MVVGTHAFRVHFWRCPAMPGVSVFEFVQDNPLTFCALPYEMQLEPTMNGPGELAGLYTPLLAFPDPPFPSVVIASSLASIAPHRIVLVGVTAELHAFFRAADPVLSHTAVLAATELPRSPAASVPTLVAPMQQPQQQQQQQQDEVVLSTQPSTPVLSANSRPAAVDYAVLPQFWPSPQRITCGPLRIPVPSETLSLPPIAQTTVAATTSTSAPDTSAMEVERMRAMHRNHRHARHESDGIETLALAARTMDASTSIDDDLMVDDDDDGELGTLLPAAAATTTTSTAATSTTVTEQSLPPRTYVITPGLRTPDLDEEVARVLFESAQYARELLLAASQPPSDAEESDEGDEGDDGDMEDLAVGAGDDSGDYTEAGARRRHHRDGTPISHRKTKRTFVNRGKIGGGATVPTCRWDGCNKTFGAISDLTHHLQSHTATQSVHVCKWDGCARVGKPFGNHSGLFRHLRYHTGDKPCRCNVPGCGFSSVDNGELRRHLHLVHRLELDCNKQ